MYLDVSLNPKCKECNSIDVDFTFKKIFNCLVCNKCKDQYPEKYSLLTKTECKEVGFLLRSKLVGDDTPGRTTFSLTVSDLPEEYYGVLHSLASRVTRRGTSSASFEGEPS